MGSESQADFQSCSRQGDIWEFLVEKHISLQWETVKILSLGYVKVFFIFGL